MHTFTSPHKKLKIFGQSGKKKQPEWQAIFRPNGVAGMFQTEDEELVKKMKTHKQYGKLFAETSLPKGESARVIVGERSAGTSQENYVRLGELKASILKKDGSYRKDATDDLIKEYESLKEGLRV